MRALNIVCGVAVLLLTVHFTHFLHRFLVDPPSHSPAFWAGMVAATVVWIFSFVGGCLLLRRGR
jgi:hypothetical protein